MKIKNLIKLLKQYDEEFDVKINLFEPDHGFYGMHLRTFNIDGIADVGHFDKAVILDIKEV
jgi:hypothetical protein